jgi:signal transduction histidine kinase
MYSVPWWRPPFDFVWLLGLMALAVALGTYPIVRRLTKRLEALQQGVDRWGQGDLSHRVPEGGHDEVAFLAQRFNIAAERVQALLLSHKALLANASHELRSPLTRIRMGLEFLGNASPAARDEIARNIRELDQLIDEILLASRLDASPIDIGTVEPVDLVGLCAEECAQAGAELEVPTGQTSLIVPGVAKLLHRVVRNLLDNARRHAAGQVTLSLQQADTQAVIQVCDHGPGVPPELRARIFEPFYRLPGASERDGGVGLGLALVKSITQRHGGSVRCEERPGGGACFVVALPQTR